MKHAKSKNLTMRNISVQVAVLTLSMLVVIFLVGLTMFQNFSMTADERVAANTQGISANASATLVKDGQYAGWTHYHNSELGFSINASPVVKISDYANASQSDPTYSSFLMDLYSDSSGRTIELLHLAIYDADLQTSARDQDTARSDIYQVAPTKQDATIAEHKAIKYYYDGDIRDTLYLIEDGPRTIAINGFVHTKNSQAVANFWKSFDNTVASFSIDSSAGSN
jgi:hypothetical protein